MCPRNSCARVKSVNAARVRTDRGSGKPGAGGEGTASGEGNTEIPWPLAEHAAHQGRGRDDTWETLLMTPGVSIVLFLKAFMMSRNSL